MRASLRLLVLLLFVAVPAAAQNGDQPITVTDLFNIRQIGDVNVSPDGRYVLYTVRQAYQEGEGAEAKYGYRTHLWLADAAGREAPRPLTRGDQSASQPAWHPDGDRIAFVRVADGRSQVFILPLDGGEAWQLTRVPRGASQPTWSPDGSWLLFASSLREADVREAAETGAAWNDERPGRRPGDAAETGNPDGSVAEVRAWLDANARDNNPRVLTRLNLQGENDLEPALSYRHLYVIEPVEGAEARAVTRGWASYGGGVWMPNGRQVLVTGNPESTIHPDRERQSNLYLADVETGRLDLFLSREGYSLFGPQPSPDGAHVVFAQVDLDDPGFAQAELVLYATDGRSEPRVLTSDFDRSPGQVRWTPEGRFLYFTAPTDGGVPLYRVSPFGARLADADTLAGSDSLVVAEAEASDSLASEGPVIEQLTPITQGVGSYDVTRSTVFYVVTEVENPNELYRAGLRFDAPQRLTRHNAEWLATRRISRPEAYAYTTTDSLEIDYWVMAPTFARSGERYPLMLQIHGGPSAMWGPGEGSMWHEFQLMAARGYGIVYSNPRGSGGYGHAFQRANFQNWGAAPAADVLGAADRAARLPWADSDRQVVTGGSYAGYLTAWIVAHDHRFKAAVAQRGVYDLRTFFGEGNAWRLVPSHFGGYPWEDSVFVASGIEALTADSAAADSAGLGAVSERLTIPQLLARESPLTYVARIRTPLLIIHGDEDRRTGFVQSEMLYRSLKALDRPVELVRYPGGNHELSRSGHPKQRLDRLLRIYEFMERYVR